MVTLDWTQLGAIVAAVWGVISALALVAYKAEKQRAAKCEEELKPFKELGQRLVVARRKLKEDGAE